MSDLEFIRVAGAVEVLFGHLPIYGAMLVVLVYGSHPELRPAISAL